MVKYVKRKDLDVVKYDNCIKKAFQSRIYAFSWYLDIVADNWDVLVLEDYKAVMPIPWKQKYFIKHVVQPPYCQQLGVFSEEKVTENLINTFLSKIPSTFIKFNYQFNSSNAIGSRGVTRNNYILKLNSNYSELKANYKKVRVQQAKKQQLIIGQSTAIDLIEISKKYYKFLNLTDEDYQRLETLINTSIKRNKGFIVAVFNNSGTLLGSSFFIKSKNRIIYLYSAVTTEGRKKQVASLIIDSVIEKYAETPYILDFEGSMISGISSFFKSFGAKLETYKLLEYNKLTSILRLFKK